MFSQKNVRMYSKKYFKKLLFVEIIVKYNKLKVCIGITFFCDKKNSFHLSFKSSKNLPAAFQNIM